jgi:membrane-anchored protein YejM (alkaline phosphatase superfamily)
MFGLLSGLPVSYYAIARREKARPLPLQVLAKLGYSTSAYYSQYLSTYDGLCDLFFRGVVDHIDDENASTADGADAALVERYVADVAKRDPSLPTFDYVVLESSHYDYAYPAAFEKFTPTATLGVGLRDGILRGEGIVAKLRPRAPAIRNRYQNSIVWVDSLIDKIAAAWAARRDDVIFVVVGDHGEAFWEHDTFGHGMSLNDEQVRVPLVMCLPGVTTTRYAYSSHEDVFPTIFDFMGLKTGAAFMAGKSLLGYDPARDLAVFGYGLTGTESDARLGVAGDGLKVVYLNRPPFETLDVFREGDVEVPLPAGGDLEARIEDLKARAFEERVIR